MSDCAEIACAILAPTPHLIVPFITFY